MQSANDMSGVIVIASVIFGILVLYCMYCITMIKRYTGEQVKLLSKMAERAGVPVQDIKKITAYLDV